MNFKTFKIARFFGIALISCAVVLLFVNPKPENNLPAGFITPIIALEFIQSPQEVARFFEVNDVAAYVQGLNLGNSIDYLFMCLYSGLLFFIALGIYHITQAKTMFIAMLFCFSMLIFDGLENLQLHQIVQLYKTGTITENLSLLNIFTWLKWSSIASCFLLFSPFFFKGKVFHKIIGALCVVCFGLCIAAFLQHGILNEIFASSVVIVFLLMVVFVFTFRPKIVE
jgi:hypothetical protein